MTTLGAQAENSSVREALAEEPSHPSGPRELRPLRASTPALRSEFADAPILVIGSGPAGSAAALELANAGLPVVILEAGSEWSAIGLTARLRGMTVAKYRKPLRLREGVTMTGDPETQLFEEIAPGGLSNHWSCAVPRFSEEDFADARRAGEEYTWPIGYADLAPWYERVEPLLHIAGAGRGIPQLPAGQIRRQRVLSTQWQAVDGEARKLGRSITAMPYAYGGDTTVTFSGTAFNSFVRVVRPLERQGKVKVRYGARVLRLEWSPTGRRVEAVTIWNAARHEEESIRCRAVVIAAGAINSAQILLESKSVDFPTGLGNEHDLVGRYLHDHPLGKLIIDFPSPLIVHPPAYVLRPTLEHAPPLYAAACMQWSNATLVAKSFAAGHPGRMPQLGFSVFGTMVPQRENYVALDPKRKRPDIGSRLLLHCRHPAEANAALEKAKNDLLDLLEHVGWRPTVNSWKIEPVGNSNHYGGTCRMHASPRYGVVDGWSRLHACRNVVVADSATFTTGPEKNPVLTSMALAARAANRLSQELRSGEI